MRPKPAAVPTYEARAGDVVTLIDGDNDRGHRYPHAVVLDVPCATPGKLFLLAWRDEWYITTAYDHACVRCRLAGDELAAFVAGVPAWARVHA